MENINVNPVDVMSRGDIEAPPPTIVEHGREVITPQESDSAIFPKLGESPVPLAQEQMKLPIPEKHHKKNKKNKKKKKKEEKEERTTGGDEQYDIDKILEKNGDMRAMLRASLSGDSDNGIDETDMVPPSPPDQDQDDEIPEEPSDPQEDSSDDEMNEKEEEEEDEEEEEESSTSSESSSDDESDNDEKSEDDDTTPLSKIELLAKSEELESYGFPPTVRPNIDTPYDRIKIIVEAQERQMSTGLTIHLMGEAFALTMNIVETLNDRMDPIGKLLHKDHPLKLRGLGKTVRNNLPKYRHAFREIARKMDTKKIDKLGPIYQIGATTISIICQTHLMNVENEMVEKAKAAVDVNNTPEWARPMMRPTPPPQVHEEEKAPPPPPKQPLMETVFDVDSPEQVDDIVKADAQAPPVKEENKGFSIEPIKTQSRRKKNKRNK